MPLADKEYWGDEGGFYESCLDHRGLIAIEELLSRITELTGYDIRLLTLLFLFYFTLSASDLF